MQGAGERGKRKGEIVKGSRADGWGKQGDKKKRRMGKEEKQTRREE